MFKKVPTIYTYTIPPNNVYSIFLCNDFIDPDYPLQTLFFQSLKKLPQTNNILQADIAFFPLPLATLFKQQQSSHPIQYVWRTHWQQLLVKENIRKKVPHVMVLTDTLKNINLTFIPRDIHIFAYETESNIHGTVSNFGCYNRVITIPYFLEIDYSKNNKYQRGMCCTQLKHSNQNNNPNNYNIIDYNIINNNVIDYNLIDYKYILILSKTTERIFYKALQCNTIPIIFRDALVHYNKLCFPIPIKQICILISEDTSSIELKRLVYRFTLRKYRLTHYLIQKYKHLFNYHDENLGISTPIYYLLQTYLSKPKDDDVYVFIPTLPSSFHIDLLPCHVSQTDIVCGDFASQYELEIFWHKVMLSHFIITHCIERCDFVFIPFYTFLSGWKNKYHFQPKFIVDKLLLLKTLLTSWTTTTKPHVLVYSDVCWENPDFWLLQCNLPSNTHFISLESITMNSIHTYTSPYLSGFTLKYNPKKLVLSYIGRFRLPFLTKDQYPSCKFVFMELEGWKSINEISFLQHCQDIYTKSLFSLQPPGDRDTRRGFFQSLLCNCVPVIFESNKKGYQQHTNLPIETICIVLPSITMSISDILIFLQTVNPLPYQQAILQHKHHYVFDIKNPIPVFDIVKKITNKIIF